MFKGQSNQAPGSSLYLEKAQYDGHRVYLRHYELSHMNVTH